MRLSNMDTPTSRTAILTNSSLYLQFRMLPNPVGQSSAQTVVVVADQIVVKGGEKVGREKSAGK